MNAPAVPGVLLAHGRYRAYGGEDATVEAEAALLRARGHTVTELVREAEDPAGAAARVRLSAAAAWSRDARRAAAALIARDRPAVLHAHNTFPSLSPSIYRAARDAGVAVVQSVHNYRLVCPATTLFRDGRPCRECVGRAIGWPGVVHGCRDSRTETAAVAAVVGGHRIAGTWTRAVDLYLADSTFVHDVLVDGGLPAERIAVMPPIVDVLPAAGAGGAADAGAPAAPAGPPDGPYALFAGRLVAEKGTAALAAAAAGLAGAIDVVVCGDGPGRPALERAGVIVLGHRDRADVHQLMAGALVVVVPSVWDEPFGLVAAEAMGCGVPVVATRAGGLADIVDEGVTGWFVPRDDPAALADRLRWCVAHPEEVAAAGGAARLAFDRDYSPDAGYRRLLEAFALAVDRARRSNA